MFDILLIPAVILLLIFIIWISACLWGAPFQPSSDRALKNILTLANPKKNQRMAELGSGDGKIVIEFAKRGVESHGFEINPLLVWISRRRIKNLCLQKNEENMNKLR